MYRIAVLLPNNLGDVFMALPVLSGLKDKYRGSHITFFVEDGFECGLEQNSACDVIFKFPRKQIRDSARGNDWGEGLAELHDMVDKLRKERFDYVVNLAQHPYVSYIVTLIEGRLTHGAVMLREGNIALNDMWSQYLYSIPFARSFNRLHATDVFKRIANVCGPVKSSMTLTDDEIYNAGNYLSGKGCLKSSKIIIFQPGAAFQSKRWLVENFIELGKMLICDGCSIVITGAPSETGTASEISAALNDNCYSAAGELTFRETVALASLCYCCVTGDTALMHAAAALKKKVIAIFGSTSPVETGPYGAGHTVIAGQCSRRPCFCSECESRQCMKSVLPETVYHAINGTLTASNHCGCDIYETGFDCNGDYKIQPVAGTAGNYYNPAGAEITYRSFTDSVSSDAADHESLLLYRRQSQCVVDVILKMESELTHYIDNETPDSVRSFETIKQELATIKGIGEFWTALLNIRLNSAALLDFRKGIVESRDICRRTRLQIAHAVKI